VWLGIIGSRFVSQWLDLFGYSIGGGAGEEGSPLDAFVFFALIVSGAITLIRRRVSLTTIITNNIWLAAFLTYCLISIVWSDFPFVALKRWIKVIGHPIMALILLTEPDPEKAVITFFKRTAYLLIPLSILFIKYFPEWGRGFDEWSGAPINTGITADKNALGHDCFILGFFFFWYLIKILRSEATYTRRYEVLLSSGFLVMIGWLLFMAHSSTSLLSVLIGMLVCFILGFEFVNKRYVGRYVISSAAILLFVELVSGFSSSIVAALGKDPTLTGRTELWQELLNFDINPVLGAGFESFWLGKRLDKLWEHHWWHPNQAHNGYLDTYLHLGLVGVLLLAALVFAAFGKIRFELTNNFEAGRFKLGLLIAIVVYNWTESAFKGLSFVWFIFYLIALDYPTERRDDVGEFEDLPEEIKVNLVHV
jgi:O-antigen ligase